MIDKSDKFHVTKYFQKYNFDIISEQPFSKDKIKF